MKTAAKNPLESNSYHWIVLPNTGVQICRGFPIAGSVAMEAEKVFEVAGGPNEASVDLDTCTPLGAGARSLCEVWTDPEFETTENAFYYARVLENPTCRWHQHLCVEAKVDCADPATVGRGYDACCSSTFPRTQQERAWTSPIWYSPR